MDWQEFRDQAARDMLSCKMLRSDGDFGNAAYLLQQSLEKYVKAYLFKFKIFADNPRNLGHLPLKALFKKLSDETEKTSRHSNNPQTKIMFKKFHPTIKEIVDLFEKIKDSKNPTWRNAIWKDSLGLSLNNDEVVLIKQTKSRWETERIPELSNTATILSTGLDRLKKQSQDPIQRQIIEKEIRDKTGLSFDQAINALTTINDNLKNLSVEMPSDLTFLEDLLKPDGQVEPKNPAQFEFNRLIQGAWIFNFRNEIIQTFTHEDIGRYPTDMDGINSRTIYAQMINELDKFIEKIEDSCKKINEKIDDVKVDE